MNGSSAGMVVVLELKKISTEQPHLHHYKSGEARYAVLKRTVPEEADSGDTILNSIYICCKLPPNLVVDSTSQERSVPRRTSGIIGSVTRTSGHVSAMYWF